MHKGPIEPERILVFRQLSSQHVHQHPASCRAPRNVVSTIVRVHVQALDFRGANERMVVQPWCTGRPAGSSEPRCAPRQQGSGSRSPLQQ
jgi:hypothetical protein